MSGLSPTPLQGKVAVITGASSGLGVAFAKALSDAGATVILGGRRLERLSDVKSAIEASGGTALAFKTDVTSPEDCEALAKETVAQCGRIDILVNCAGLGSAVPALKETPEQFRSVVDTNLMGTYWMSQSAARLMEPGSCIINIGSVLGLTTVGHPQAAYSASKAAIIGLTRDLAQQWSGRRGIRVNALAPGYFPSEMTDEMSPEAMDEIVRHRVPLGRLGRVEECAAVVVFLASDAASYVNGVTLPVDGGLLTM